MPQYNDFMVCRFLVFNPMVMMSGSVKNWEIHGRLACGKEWELIIGDEVKSLYVSFNDLNFSH